jgi:hypothetical protein
MMFHPMFPPSPPSLKTVIKELIVSDLDITPHAIDVLLRRMDRRSSGIVIWGVRNEFLHDLRVLDHLGAIDLSSFPRGKYASIANSPNIQRRIPQRRSLTRPEPDNSINWWRSKRSKGPRTISAQRRVILAMLEHVGRPMGPKALARHCSMAPGAVRYLLHMMLRAGQVERVERGRYRLKKGIVDALY